MADTFEPGVFREHIDGHMAAEKAKRLRDRRARIDKMLGKAPPPGPNTLYQEFTPDGTVIFATKLIPPGEGVNRGF
jgi:hypothetical protein